MLNFTPALNNINNFFKKIEKGERMKENAKHRKLNFISL